MCVESLRILNGERSRGGGGGGGGCDGVVERAVERQRVQGLRWRDCRSSGFQQLDCRNIGAVEAMAGGIVCAIWIERCRRGLIDGELLSTNREIQ